MLQQILTHTPVWVWAVLAFLVYRGLLASVARTLALKRVFLLPLVLLALSLQGITSSFGAGVDTLPVWFAGMLAGGAFAWPAFDAGSVRTDPLRGTVSLRGSWMPLLLMLGVFSTKYVVGVALALHPDLQRQPQFVIGVCALYGLLNGMFVGPALRIMTLYRQACTMPHSLQ